jgi:hypothetical protein
MSFGQRAKVMHTEADILREDTGDSARRDPIGPVDINAPPTSSAPSSRGNA